MNINTYENGIRITITGNSDSEYELSESFRADTTFHEKNRPYITRQLESQNGPSDGQMETSL